MNAPVSVEWPADKLPFLPGSLYTRFQLLVADTVHPNVLAGSLALLLPLAAAALLAMSAALVLSASRGAWLACSVALLGLAALRWRRGWMLLPLVAAGTIAALALFGAGPLLEALAAGGTAGSAVTSVEGRLEIWSRAVYMVQDFPCSGAGMGSFGPVADLLYPFFLAAPDTIPHAHNLFLQVAVDLGIPGLIAWLSVLGASLAAAWSACRRPARRREAAGFDLLSGLGAGLLGSQVALIVLGLTDAVTWGMVRPAPLVWAIWGLAAAAANLRASYKGKLPFYSPANNSKKGGKVPSRPIARRT